ncbi:MAG: hypothetical protein ABI970_00575 [Chloroflexota bacterium]
MSKVLSLRQKFTTLLLGLSCVLTACNLQQTPVEVTPTLQPTPTALSQPTDQPTRTPIGQPTVQQAPQSSVVAPTLSLLQTPTALPLGVNPNATGTNGTVIPTVSTQQAVKSTTIQVAAGKTVGLNYVVTATGGSLTLTMQGPAGVVWQKTFTASETGRIEVAIQQAGAYDVMAQTDRFEGNYQLSWD